MSDKKASRGMIVRDPRETLTLGHITSLHQAIATRYYNIACLANDTSYLAMAVTNSADLYLDTKKILSKVAIRFT